MFRIVAFTKKWKFKGYVDPSIRDSVSYIQVEDAISFIRTAHKPKGERWLIEVEEDIIESEKKL